LSVEKGGKGERVSTNSLKEQESERKLFINDPVCTRTLKGQGRKNKRK